MTSDLGWQSEISEDSSQSDADILSSKLNYYKNLLGEMFDLSTSIPSSSLRDLLGAALTAARKLTTSDAGSIYLIDRSSPFHTVCFELSQNDSQPDRSLVNFAVPLNQNSIVGHVAVTGEIINLSDANDLPADAAYHHHKTFDIDIEYVTLSVLAVPMFNSENITSGVLQLINRKNQDVLLTLENVHEVTLAYSDLDQKLLEAIAQQIAPYIERYIQTTNLNF
jgi:GAF domain-containing protein